MVVAMTREEHDLLGTRSVIADVLAPSRLTAPAAPSESSIPTQPRPTARPDQEESRA